MAYQTSKILQKHSTPRSIGRLMDADFAGLPSALVVSQVHSYSA
jgi:hypothetical protein